MSQVNINDLSVAERQARSRELRGLDLYVFEEILGARRCIEGRRCLYRWLSMEFDVRLPNGPTLDRQAWIDADAHLRFSTDLYACSTAEAVLKKEGVLPKYAEALSEALGLPPGDWSAERAGALLVAGPDVRVRAMAAAWQRSMPPGHGLARQLAYEAALVAASQPEARARTAEMIEAVFERCLKEDHDRLANPRRP